MTRERFSELWERVGASGDPAPVHERLSRLYSEPHRHYHDLRHIQTCLAVLDEVRHLAGRPDEVELALWFHDVVCEPGATDNEERSAELAVRVLRDAGLPEDTGERVAAMILATRHETPPEEEDAMLVVDIDLVGLGSEPEVFRENGRRIREEYRRYSEEEFREGQAALFGRFLARPTIYVTSRFHDLYEEAARRNLRDLLARR